MTQPPYGQPYPDAHGAPAPAWDPAVPPPEPPRRGRRALLVGGITAGVLVLAGGGYAVASYLSGGGAQPQDVLPDTTLAFVTLDLDPAMGQKADVAALLAKFPAVEDAPEDLRGDLLDRLFEDSGVDVDYARDVEPWLGDRMALAAVPAPEAELGMAPVLALAVADEPAMTESLDRLQDTADFGWAVRDGYVLVALDQATADRAAGAETVLADDSDYATDRDALGGDHVAVAWADLGSVQGFLGETMAAAGGGGLFTGQDMSGRVILGLRADDGALVIEGLDVGVSDLGPLAGGGEPTRLAQELPEDALAAFSGGGLGEAVVDQWAQFEESGALAGAEEQIASLGLDLPDDLRSVLGSDLAVVVRGDLSAPAFGARATTEDPQRALEVIEGLMGTAGGEVPLSTGPVDGGYVVASDPGLADTLAEDGGLGDTEAFRAAVAYPDDASALVFVDLAAVVDSLVAQGGPTGKEAAQWRAVEALGVSGGPTEEGSRFVLRITTR